MYHSILLFLEKKLWRRCFHWVVKPKIFHLFIREFQNLIFWKKCSVPMTCDNMRHSTIQYMAVNPRYETYRVEANTVNMRHSMCRICDSMRSVADFRIESVVLQVSKIYRRPSLLAGLLFAVLTIRGFFCSQNFLFAVFPSIIHGF